MYSTRQAAAKMCVSFRTLQKWLKLEKIKPSKAAMMPYGQRLLLWSEADIIKGLKMKEARRLGRPSQAGEWVTDLSLLRNEFIEQE